jgi:hypothetical protein
MAIMVCVTSKLPPSPKAQLSGIHYKEHAKHPFLAPSKVSVNRVVAGWM